MSLSKEQAEHAAEALLADAKARRLAVVERRTRSMVRIFPRLKRVPVMQREAVVQDAKFSADRHWLGRALQVLLALTFVAFMWGDWNDHASAARAFGWSAALVFFAWQAQRQICIRKTIREYSAGDDAETRTD